MSDQLTQKELKRILNYCPETGSFIWVVKKANKISIGDLAGSNGHAGYLQVMIEGKNYLLHRLACFYMTGEWPDQVDHINHVRNDNRWGNLRFASHAINNKNQGMQYNCPFGITGVTFIKNRYLVRINDNKESVYLGRHKDFFEACCARKSAEAKYGFHENHGIKTSYSAK